MRASGLAAMLLACGPGLAAAQVASVPFGGAEHDASQPVEITSDALALDQAAGTAVFTGNVRVGQGMLRMAADRLEVFYADGEGESGSGDIDHMVATGGVTLTNGTESAESRLARYLVPTGIVEMEGDVLLTQGPNALASEKLRIDLEAGTGVLEGRVKTIITPAGRP